MDIADYDIASKVIRDIESDIRGARFKYILSTHKHNDHIGANLKFKEERPDLEIICGAINPSLIPGHTTVLNDL